MHSDQYVIKLSSGKCKMPSRGSAVAKRVIKLKVAGLSFSRV